MPLFTYDSDADALYILLVDEVDAVVARTVELSSTLHVDLDDDDRVVGIEILSPRSDEFDLRLVRDRFGVDVHIPFSFAA